MLLMGKSTMSMAIFNSYVTNYQRVPVLGCPNLPDCSEMWGSLQVHGNASIESWPNGPTVRIAPKDRGEIHLGICRNPHLTGGFTQTHNNSIHLHLPPGYASRPNSIKISSETSLKYFWIFIIHSFQRKSKLAGPN